MKDKPRCKYYAPIVPDRREYCANCAKGLGKWCEEFLDKHKEYQTTQKFMALDMMMRTNKGIRFT